MTPRPYVRNRNHAVASRQSGFAFIVALVLLLAITLLGVATIRAGLVEQRLANASFDRNIAFQSAEAAIRIGERMAFQHAASAPLVNRMPSDDSCDASIYRACLDGLCPQVDPDCPLRSTDPSFTAWATVGATDLDLGALAGQRPAYLVEYLGGDFNCNEPDPTKPVDPSNKCKRYRISTRGEPAAGERATVFLEVVFATE